MRNRSMRRAFAVLATTASLSAGLMAMAGAAGAAPAETARPVPVVLDGVRYQPYDPAVTDRTLFYVVDRAALAEGVVYAFHTRAAALARLDMTNPAAAASARAQSATVPLTNISAFNRVQLFEKKDRGGDVLDLGPGEIKRYLKDEPRGCFPWPFCAGDWNNVISSVDTNGGSVSLHRDNDLKGPELFLNSGENDVNLSNIPLGNGTWDNRVSSLYVHS
jgi:hypothetical protein